MRLIDADLLKKNCKCTGKFEDNFVCVDLIELAKVIDNQPTAYNVEDVVEQLGERINFHSKLAEYEMNLGTIIDMEKHKYAILELDKAIEIVKAGGTYEHD